MAVAATLDDDARSEREKEIDEAYELFKKILGQYEETLNMSEDLAREKAETIREIFDKQLSEVQYTIEINLNLNDFSRTALEFFRSNLEDIAWGFALDDERLLKTFQNRMENLNATADEFRNDYDTHV